MPKAGFCLAGRSSIAYPLLLPDIIMESQMKLIRAYLESGHHITPLDALHLFNCFRLSARIYDLRDRGMHINVRSKDIISGGKKKTVAEYFIKK